MENAFNVLYKFKINAYKNLIFFFFLNLKFALTSVQNMTKIIGVMFKQRRTASKKPLSQQLLCP